jgi:AcrR family transcriptional regulator
MVTVQEPPIRPLRADARRNREAIVAAADELFRADGVAFQMDAVAQRAGLGVGTLYRHFPNKDDLLAQLVINRFETALAEAEAALAEEDSAVAVRMFFLGVLKIVQEDPGVMMALGGGITDGGMEQCAFYEAELHERKLALITRAQADGAIRPDLTIDDFGALMYGMTHAMLAGANGDLLVEVILEGLRVPKACPASRASISSGAFSA